MQLISLIDYSQPVKQKETTVAKHTTYICVNGLAVGSQWAKRW